MIYGLDLENSTLMKDVINEIILECPTSGNPVNCPFHEKRKQPLSAIFTWVESLTDKERINVYRIHSECQKFKCQSLHGRLEVESVKR